MKALKLILIIQFIVTSLFPNNYNFNFGDKNNKKGYISIKENSIYNEKTQYGYDFKTKQNGNDPFFFSVKLPEGNYLVKVLLGSDKYETITTIKAESRRLMTANIKTARGKTASHEFVINIRTPEISPSQSIKIKEREKAKLNWDEKLTLEFNGIHPSVLSIQIKPVIIPTVFLAGNSTVVDQDEEPWCGWGQMLPLFLNTKIAVANYAESGESASSFISSQRFAKIMSVLKKGDYLFIEFGHNDQKLKGEYSGPFGIYKKNLTYMIDETLRKGGIPVLVTPMNRRKFDENNKVINTLGDYPEAVKQVAKERNVSYIDLNNMTKIMYEAWGSEESKKAFVHYPRGSFPGQTNDLEDDTHCNNFGGYEICKCIIDGIISNKISLKKFIRNRVQAFDPAKPDHFITFSVPATPFSSALKPEGN